MRNPSLHITESDLIIILQGEFHDLGPFKWSHKDMARKIMEKGKSFAAVSRGVKVSNDKLDRKVNKLTSIGRSHAAIFAQTLLLVRRHIKHRGVQLIKPGSPGWLEVKEVCKLATEFCNEFQIEIKIGYTQYLRLGLKKMKNFSLNKLKQLHGAICNEYEAIQIIQRDNSPSRTEECHNYYLAMVAERTGLSQGYKDFPEKYQYFVFAKQEAEKYRVTCRVFITAQFKGFEWNNSIPDPSQMVGPKAIDRLQKYAFEQNIQLGEKTMGINFKEIRKNGKNNS